jgi:hypothetical protein
MNKRNLNSRVVLCHFPTRFLDLDADEGGVEALVRICSVRQPLEKRNGDRMVQQEMHFGAAQDCVVDSL